MSPADVVVETVPFTAGDGMKLNLKRIRGPVAPWKGPVLLAPGAGVRAELHFAKALPHGYFNFTRMLPVAKKLADKAADALGRALAD